MKERIEIDKEILYMLREIFLRGFDNKEIYYSEYKQKLDNLYLTKHKQMALECCNENEVYSSLGVKCLTMQQNKLVLDVIRFIKQSIDKRMEGK